MNIPELPPGYEIDYNDTLGPEWDGWQVYERGESLDFAFSEACGNTNEQPKTREEAVALCWKRFKTELSAAWVTFFESLRTRDITPLEAEEIFGERLDRRKKYCLHQGIVCEIVRFKRECLECEGFGCSKCGGTGQRWASSPNPLVPGIQESSNR